MVSRGAALPLAGCSILARTVAEGPGQGYRHDRTEQFDNSPIYGVTPQPLEVALADTPISEAGADQIATPVTSNYQTGFHYRTGDIVHSQDAWLKDAPDLDAAENSGQIFETAALVLKGKQAGRYLGSVKWGWESKDTTDAQKLDLAPVSKGDPSPNFLEPAKKWNEATVNKKLGVAAKTVCCRPRRLIV